MDSKTLYLKNYHKEYKFSCRKLVNNQIECFFEIENSAFKLPQHKYKIGDDVYLNKNNLLHGVGKNEKAVDYISKNGIICKEATGSQAGHAVKYVSGFWRVFEKVKLSKYITNYSGIDVSYNNQGHLVAYGKVDEFIDKMKNVDHWKWLAESSMEIRFMPSLARDINQYGFILNVESSQAKKMLENDINTDKFSKRIKNKFGLNNLNGRGKKEGVFNFINRASYVVLGLNKCFIEGILVGRKVEKDKVALKELKLKFPNCYICSLDGKVLMA